MRGATRWSALVVIACSTATACSTTHRYSFLDGSQLASAAPAEIEAKNVLAFYTVDPDTVVQRLGASACCGAVRLTVRPGRHRITVQSWKEVEKVRCTEFAGRMVTCDPTGAKVKPQCTVEFTAEPGARYRVAPSYALAATPQYAVGAGLYRTGTYRVDVYQLVEAAAERSIARCVAKS